MRMYALYDRDRRILGFLVAVAAASVVVGCVSPLCVELPSLADSPHPSCSGR